jgi:acyl-CoA thioester hydrolase
VSGLRVVEVPVRVRYAETDQMGVAYYANYLVWFEMGRSEYCRAAGYPYSRIEEDGFVMVVAEASIRYKKPACYDDELVVRTRMTEVRPRVCRFAYEVVKRGGGDVLAEGETVHVVVDRESGRPTRMPQSYIDIFTS